MAAVEAYVSAAYSAQVAATTSAPLFRGQQMLRFVMKQPGPSLVPDAAGKWVPGAPAAPTAHHALARLLVAETAQHWGSASGASRQRLKLARRSRAWHPWQATKLVQGFRCSSSWILQCRQRCWATLSMERGRPQQV
ncbi:unnamed protein product [Symbiodinium natans]|uniref:Uncharacterized protein n=1 Tax=Symbiodinium natans TaxID=878477 RepID=A0A812LD38_9DINO|nr:unnamed protein product [Symbiodinium natans]